MTTLSPTLDVSALRPRKVLVKRGDLDGFVIPHGSRIEEKLDGEFAVATHSDRGAGESESVLAGETIKRKSGGLYTTQTRAGLATHGSCFVAFDILRYHGQDVTYLPLRDRLTLFYEVARAGGFATVRTPHLTETAAQFYDRIIADGGEGIVIKDLAAPYGEMWACKRGEIHLCKLTRIGSTQSVGICDAQSGQDRGNIKLGGGRCDQVRVGSLIRVEAMGETDSGKLRQPVPCREWLHQF